MGRYLHMQPSEVMALPNDFTQMIVKATNRLLKSEAEERWEMLKLQLKAAGMQVR